MQIHYMTLQIFCAPRRPRDSAHRTARGLADEPKSLGCPDLSHSMNFEFRKGNTPRKYAQIKAGAGRTLLDPRVALPFARAAFRGCQPALIDSGAAASCKFRQGVPACAVGESYTGSRYRRVRSRATESQP